MSDSIFYFAYGSNADPARFRDRVGDWRTRRPARLEGHRLRFASSVRSEGGGGAVVDDHDGGTVDGVLFEISPAQLDAMDREEFDPARDRERTGRRLRRPVVVDGATVEAELYTVEDDGGRHPPSAAYLGHIVDGLRDAGHDEAAIERVHEAVRRAAGPG